jgi:hypothetical protein
MFCKKRGIPVVAMVILALVLAGCSNHPASDSVKAFAMAMADSSWSDAWGMLTPGTRAAWDSTAVVMQRFGYTESSEYLSTLEVPVTSEEFAELDGELLFERMAQTYPDAADLSGEVRGVELSDSVTALVTVATVDGPQIIPVRLIGENWLLDLTTLTPPPADTGGE